MNYKEISEPHNAQAVALFREHLPPHLADLCIEAHIESVKNDEKWLKLDASILESALTKCVDWRIDYRASRIAFATTDNTVDLEAFYTEFPELRPKEESKVKGYEHLVGKWVKCIRKGHYLTCGKWYKCESIDNNDEMPLLRYDDNTLTSPVKGHLEEYFDLDNPLDTPPTETQEATEQVVTKPPFTVKVIDCLTNEVKQQHVFYRMVEAVGKFDELLSLCSINEYAVMHNNLVGINQDGIMVILIEK